MQDLLRPIYARPIKRLWHKYKRNCLDKEPNTHCQALLLNVIFQVTLSKQCILTHYIMGTVENLLILTLNACGRSNAMYLSNPAEVTTSPPSSQSSKRTV